MGRIVMSIEDDFCCGKVIGSFDLSEFANKVRVDAIDEYSNKLWQVIEKATVNCKLDFTIDDLHNLEIIIKGLAEELKEQNNGK